MNSPDTCSRPEKIETAHGPLALPVFLPDATRAVVKTLDSADLAALVGERFGIRVHRRSVERALERRKKGRRKTP